MHTIETNDLEWTRLFLIFALTLIFLPFVVPVVLAIL